jgi:hypothetical protein
MSTTTPAERVCMLCAESYPAGTVCPEHPGEVLVDPSREAVLDLMEAGTRPADRVRFAS